MTENESKRVLDISQRLGSVIRFLKENDPQYYSDEDVDSLVVVLENISKVLVEMAHNAPDAIAPPGAKSPRTDKSGSSGEPGPSGGK